MALPAYPGRPVSLVVRKDPTLRLPEIQLNVHEKPWKPALTSPSYGSGAGGGSWSTDGFGTHVEDRFITVVRLGSLQSLKLETQNITITALPILTHVYFYLPYQSISSLSIEYIYQCARTRKINSTCTTSADAMSFWRIASGNGVSCATIFLVESWRRGSVSQLTNTGWSYRTPVPEIQTKASPPLREVKGLPSWLARLPYLPLGSLENPHH